MITEKRYQLTGYIVFLLSGICAIGSGIIVTVLQARYGLQFSETGTMLAVMSVGNMAAAFLAGVLPARIGMKATALTIAAGYCIGYAMMCVSGNRFVLTVAFLLVGLAKGCVLNQCSVLVGGGSGNKTKRMNIMHAGYAVGALSCPFLLTALMGEQGNQLLPMLLEAAVGLLLWCILLFAGLPGKTMNKDPQAKRSFEFLQEKKFWILAGILFCQNAAETSVVGWLVTYYKETQILSGTLSTYTVSIMWGATLIGRLLLAFVIPVKRSFFWLAAMGVGCVICYAGLMQADTSAGAILLLTGFSLCMAGVNPTTVGAIGKHLTAESLGILLPLGGIGAILMPWVIGFAAEAATLKLGMSCNLIPCIGIFAFSILAIRKDNS